MILIHRDTPGCPMTTQSARFPEPYEVEQGKFNALERDLPKSEDGGSFKLKNGPKCPHCGDLYTNFDTPIGQPADRFIENYALKAAGRDAKMFGKKMSLHPALMKVSGPF